MNLYLWINLMDSTMDQDAYVNSYKPYMDYDKQEMSGIGNLMQQWRRLDLFS